jgi:hypothetical protein
MRLRPIVRSDGRRIAVPNRNSPSLFSAELEVGLALPLLHSAQFVDTHRDRRNNAPMAKPEIVHRVKTYSAESGRVYQYRFHDLHPASNEGVDGTEYIYYVTSDRKTMHPVKVFVSRDGIRKWNASAGRTLNSTEEYAAAKMRLFEGFDDDVNLASGHCALVVDEKNIGPLLEKLDL